MAAKAKPQSSKRKGIPFDFGGGRVYVIAPITLAGLQRLGPKARDILTGDNVEVVSALETCIDLVHEAISHNYPELSKGDVANLLDLSNLHAVLACVLDIGGVHRKALTDEFGVTHGKLGVNHG